MFLPRVVEGSRLSVVGSDLGLQAEPAVDQSLAALRSLFGPKFPLTSADRRAVGVLIRDLAIALSELALCDRGRTVLSAAAANAVWEIVLERDGSDILFSLFRPGSLPELALTTRPVSLESAGAAVLQALDATLAGCSPAGCASTECLAASTETLADGGLGLARTRLARALDAPAPHVGLPVESLVVRSNARGKLVIRAAIQWIARTGGDASGAELRRADLYPLLFTGDVELSVGECHRGLRGVHVFVLAEQLASLASTMLEARAARRSMLCRRRFGAASCGVQLDGAGLATVLLGERGTERGTRLPPLGCEDVASAVASFGRSLVRALYRLDRGQRSNLRLSALQSALRRLDERRRGGESPQPIVNRAPESYRAFAEGESPARAARAAQSPSPAGRTTGRVGTLRFEESWRALVGGLDLGAIHLCGDGLLVGSAREIACLARTTGEVLWRRPSSRALSLPTPSGLVRLSPAGRVTLHALEDGEALLELSIRPCVGAATSGLVVYAPGLPHLLLVAEAPNHLVAIDLDAGEIRWRRCTGQRERLRLRRAGRLVIVSRGDSVLTALDLLTGEVVWRHIGPAAYRHAGTFDRGELYAVAAGARNRIASSALSRIDPWSGAVEWQRPLPRPVRLRGPVRLGAELALLVTEDATGTGVMAFERETGALRYDSPSCLGSGPSACLVIDDVVVANGECGQLVGLAAADGHVLYRHELHDGCRDRCGARADRPQGLEPVLRSGALFVPQSELYVVRPQDGALLGTVPCDLVPDLVRVDERCGVYVVEQGGHIAAYAAMPTLRLLSGTGRVR